LEVPGTSGTVGLIDQDAVWANGLITVMLDDHGFAGESRQEQRSQGRARDVNDIALA
jgi:hypothetical protein